MPSDFVSWDTVQQPFVEKSRMLAEYLQVELGRRLSIPNRGAKQADVELLKGAAMPAALLEVGFLTNPDEAATITGDAFANDLAAGVVAAMRRMRGQPALPSTADSLQTP
jgi:N-acetylmuramoyl-L-alanine amidase